MEAFTRRERRKIIARYQQGWDTVDIAPHFGASESGVRRVWGETPVLRERWRYGSAGVTE
jgi:hypothetical protein